MNADIMYLRWIIGFSILFVIRDWYIIEVRKKEPNHGRGLTMRAFISVGISFVIANDAWDILENLVTSFFIVGFIFMYGLNIVRGKHLFHLNPKVWTDALLIKIFKTPLAIFVFALIGFLFAISLKIWGLQYMLHANW